VTAFRTTGAVDPEIKDGSDLCELTLAELEHEHEMEHRHKHEHEQINEQELMNMKYICSSIGFRMELLSYVCVF
jgi:hypothetical protein